MQSMVILDSAPHTALVYNIDPNHIKVCRPANGERGRKISQRQPIVDFREAAATICITLMHSPSTSGHGDILPLTLHMLRDGGGPSRSLVYAVEVCAGNVPKRSPQ